MVSDEASTCPDLRPSPVAPIGEPTCDIEKNATLPSSHECQEKQSAFKSLGVLDRFLAIWTFLAMATGIILGNFVPSTGPAFQRGTFVGVSIAIDYCPVFHGKSLLLLLCLYAFSILNFARSWRWPGLFLPDEPELRQGLILVGLAGCIAMILIWTGLAGGDGQYCAILVALNSLLEMVLFAPLGVFFIGVISGDSVTFEYATTAKILALFLGIPLSSAMLTRFTIRQVVSDRWYDRVFLKWISPLSLIGLLFIILVLFASQGRQVVHQIVSVI
ncbi:sodium bile acid symporter family-domain-containing protein [Penicillium argentinense]|uniref:Sodium bile acid symporter family-domain-containing protein n=1 Tax=Penicillium argentinense TaxID=1131581 RepID=A0A9W9ENX3_9EURO|nr:sodium bile acid symporter family-domain-containing protein [Penicillium argentinense]KAJ5085189.1 sodium bile acid symporter family-domain-containing protein [Penicillium argentinense]